MHNRTPCAAKIFCVCGCPIIFHLIICLFYLLYCNITSWTSPKITLVLLLNTCFLQNGILFLLENHSGPAKIWPTRPLNFAMALFVAKKTCFIKKLTINTILMNMWMLISVAFATELSQLRCDGNFCLFTSQMNDLFPLLWHSYTCNAVWQMLE